MAINIGDLINSIQSNIINLAKDSLKDYVKQAGDDASSFLELTKQKLEKWTNMLLEGKLSKKDFEDLVLAQKDLMELKALKQAGLAQIKLDEFKNAAMGVLMDTVFKVVGV
ncbi:MAG TPA: hypothetical protein DIT07_15280 [Sphingobacteriaceae bacterium]|nr:hypothetical protein [Sphingobacteriaceae bacterium]